jgi:hypothetical protein
MPLASLERGRPLVWARGLLVGAALGALLLGCGERPGETSSAAAATSQSPGESAAFAASVLAVSAQARQRAAAQAAAAPPVALPAPQATATGGRRIDLRGRPDHVHTLELQPDGTWRQFCRGRSRALATGSGR